MPRQLRSSPKGKVICTASGRWVGPDEGAPSIQDAASALGKLCRYAGHCKEFWSVLVHTFVVDDLTKDEAKLYSHVHDTTESVINDVPTPFKIPTMKELEERMYNRILKDWRLPYPEKYLLLQVHQADFDALLGEIWTIGPPGLKNLKQFKKRNKKAEQLVRYYQRKYPPSDTVKARGRAVKEFVRRYNEYRKALNENN